jgi:sec-independent protein translocase protein TatA
MFGANPSEIIVLALIIFLLFGNRLPSVMKSLGKGVMEFKKGIQGIKDEIENPEKEKMEHKEVTAGNEYQTQDSEGKSQNAELNTNSR